MTLRITLFSYILHAQVDKSVILKHFGIIYENILKMLMFHLEANTTRETLKLWVDDGLITRKSPIIQIKAIVYINLHK